MDKWDLKAQIIMEFIALIGVLLFMFILFLGVTGYHTKELNQERLELTAEDMIFLVQRELELAVNSFDGYHRQFYLPAKLDNFDYDILMFDNEVVLTVNNQDFFLPTINVTGNLSKGTNIIEKRGSVIYLN